MKSLADEPFVLGDLSEFPQLAGHHYLNHAAITPPSLRVKEGINNALDRFAQRGSGAFLEVVEARRELKTQLASLFSAPSIDGSDFAWMPNTTSGVQAIAHAFPWRSSGDIIVFEGEFPTNVIPWEQAAQREGLKIHRASLLPLMSREGPEFDDIERLLKEGVQILAISAVQFQTGFRAPLEELSLLCRRYDTALFVDGIQACGSSPLPLDDIDFLATGGHKWMMAVEGAGFMYVHPRWRGRLKPQQAGWLSVEDPLDFLFAGTSTLCHDKTLRGEVSAFEGGAQSALCYAALEASVKPLCSLSVAKIYDHIQSLLDPLEQGFLERGFISARLSDPTRQSTILSVRPPSGHSLDVAEWSSALLERRVTASTPDGWLRFSPHWPNHIQQIEEVLGAIDEILSL